MPNSIRRNVAAASGFFRSKMLVPGSVQSMMSEAGRHVGNPTPSLQCVGAGHSTRFPESFRTACLFFIGVSAGLILDSAALSGTIETPSL